MRRLVTAALVLALAGCTNDSGTGQDPGVPRLAFRDLPEPASAPQERPGQPTPVAPPQTPDCLPGQVDVQVADGSVPSQPVLSALRLVATHARGPSCALREGDVPVTARDAAGTDLAVASLPAGERSLYGRRLLVPGSTTSAVLSWRRTGCASALTSIELPLVPGGQPVGPLAVPDPPCLTRRTPITVRGWGQPFTPSSRPPDSPPDPWRVLEARFLPLDGDDGDVVVRLRNPTAQPVALDPCPAYELGLRDEQRDEVVSFVREALDCAAAPSTLSPGGELDLQVVLDPLPPGLQVRAARPDQQPDGYLRFNLQGYAAGAVHAEAELGLRLR